ncbi:putative GNAT family acetyltransferase [Catenuloplanes nepalensis]|uniref:GNAT family acetyltransferase n=1 Tax=Catenuloplanes nepalensis TaxID=587533 RepID=A0ABT9MXD9_9ACTN|nr:GNAT family N-acetyltransferase [Catenuloplanes nepalensis]MDP9796109.1 putative GNAT family acetyltransferase [Catenuloplanes nepalensis]
MSDDVEVRDNPGQHRYEVTADGELAGFAVYYLEGQRIVFIHTEVAVEYEGRGLGSRLARDALDDVRGRGLRVVPACPFFAKFIRTHPEYRDLTRAGEARRAVLGESDE